MRGATTVFALCVQLNCAPIGLGGSIMQAISENMVIVRMWNLDLEGGNDFR
jgi:hypothetical protein